MSADIHGLLRLGTNARHVSDLCACPIFKPSLCIIVSHFTVLLIAAIYCPFATARLRTTLLSFFLPPSDVGICRWQLTKPTITRMSPEGSSFTHDAPFNRRTTAYSFVFSTLRALPPSYRACHPYSLGDPKACLRVFKITDIVTRISCRLTLDLLLIQAVQNRGKISLWVQMRESNPRSQGYEPCEIPLL